MELSTLKDGAFNKSKGYCLPLHYKSIGDLSHDTIKNLWKIPHDIDIIVGIPRSGLLFANVLALYMHKPLTDLDSFMDGRIYSAGERGKSFNLSKIKKVLVVDDTVSSGNALRKAKQKLSHIKEDFEFSFACAYISEESKHMVDYYIEILPLPRAFEWNLFNHEIINESCFDIDGVLCLDPPVDDDGTLYKSYISNAIPFIIPKTEINTIVTCRLEKYRPETENWLKSKGIRYKNLVMLPFKNKEERLKWGKHAEYKAEVYAKSGCVLFVESSLAQAKIISDLTGKLVFCTETFSLISSTPLDKIKSTFDKEERFKKSLPLSVRKGLSFIKRSMYKIKGIIR